MELPATPSLDHVEFDEMCSEVDEFEPLPWIAARPENGQDGEDDSSLDGQILATLVTPF